jgi:hypothetical protein
MKAPNDVCDRMKSENMKHATFCTTLAITMGDVINR